MWILTKVICDEDYSVCSVKNFAFDAKNENSAKNIVIKQMQKDQIRKEDIKEFENMNNNTVGVWDTSECDYIIYKFCKLDNIKKIK